MEKKNNSTSPHSSPGLIFHPLRLQIATLLQQNLVALFPESAEQVFLSIEWLYHQIVIPPELKQGHYSFPCFQISKILKIPPPQLAKTIFEKLQNLATPNHLTKVQPLGPYLNFYLELPFLASLLGTLIHSQEYFKFFKNFALHHPRPKTMVEYSQPNTHKMLHVGHMRNVCLGLSLVQLFKYCGTPTLACTYPGDQGTHVAKCLWYMKKFNQLPPKLHKGAWLGELYSKAHHLLEEQLGTPFEENNRKDLTQILHQLHQKNGEYYNLWQETRQWSLDLMREVYQWIGVEFDFWFYESEVDEASLKLVDQFYAQGIFKLDQGAIGMDLSAEGLGFCLLKKSDGNGLYATKDLELARRKFSEHQIEKNIYIVDNRQSLHFKQVFKTLEHMGFEHAKNCTHLAYEMVELIDGPMSSRKGNIVPLQQLIDQMQTTIKERYLLKYEHDWPAKEIIETTQKIANAAIKYGMLKIDPQKKIIFEMDEWLKIDGNSGPYLLYTYARVQAILRKNAISASFHTATLHYHELSEEQLLIKLWQFNDKVWDAAEKYAPSLLTTYLYELCQDLNTFYAHCSIAHAENESIKNSRLYLLQLFQVVLQQGLSLLGIATVERM